MKASFNGVCGRCKEFKPRCARVRMRAAGKATVYLCEETTLCADCRKALHGKYRLLGDYK